MSTAEVAWGEKAALDPYEMKPYPVSFAKLLAPLSATIESATVTVPAEADTAGLKVDSVTWNATVVQPIFYVEEAKRAAWAIGDPIPVRVTATTADGKFRPSRTIDLIVKFR